MYESEILFAAKEDQFEDSRKVSDDETYERHVGWVQDNRKSMERTRESISDGRKEIKEANMSKLRKSLADQCLIFLHRLRPFLGRLVRNKRAGIEFNVEFVMEQTLENDDIVGVLLFTGELIGFGSYLLNDVAMLMDEFTELN